MRLLFTVDPEIEVPPKTYGGIERIVDALVRHLQAAGHELALIARPGSECPADVFHPWPGLISQSVPMRMPAARSQIGHINVPLSQSPARRTRSDLTHTRR